MWFRVLLFWKWNFISLNALRLMCKTASCISIDHFDDCSICVTFFQNYANMLSFSVTHVSNVIFFTDEFAVHFFFFYRIIIIFQVPTDHELSFSWPRWIREERKCLNSCSSWEFLCIYSSFLSFCARTKQGNHTLLVAFEFSFFFSFPFSLLCGNQVEQSKCNLLTSNL